VLAQHTFYQTIVDAGSSYIDFNGYASSANSARVELSEDPAMYAQQIDQPRFCVPMGLKACRQVGDEVPIDHLGRPSPWTTGTHVTYPSQVVAYSQSDKKRLVTFEKMGGTRRVQMGFDFGPMVGSFREGNIRIFPTSLFPLLRDGASGFGVEGYSMRSIGAIFEAHDEMIQKLDPIYEYDQVD